MKKLVCLLLTFIFVFSMSTVAAVSSEDLTQTTEVKEAGVIIKAPSDWHNLTRDLTIDTPVIKELGLNPDAVIAQFIASNIYYNAFPKDSSFELLFIMMPNTALQSSPNYNDLSDAQLEEALQIIISTEIEETPTSIGAKFSDAKVYKNDKNTYIVSTAVQTFGETTINCVIVATIIYGRTYSFKLNSTQGEVTPEQEEILMLMVDNAEFLETIETATVQEPEVPDAEDDETTTGDTKEDTDVTTTTEDKDIEESTTDENNTFLIISIIAGALVLTGALITFALLAKKKKS